MSALVSGALRGDDNATARLLEAVAPAVLRVVRIVLGSNHPDQEDALQDGLVGFMSALPAFRWQSSVLHYARRIGLQRAIDIRKKQQAISRQLEKVRLMQLVSEDILAAGAADQRRQALLRGLIAELPPAQGEALILHHVLGHSVDEVAELVGVPRDTVRSRLRLGKSALRQRLKAEPRFPELEDNPHG